MLQSPIPFQSQPNWQKALASAVKSPQELLKMVELSPALLKGAREAEQAFSMRVPHSYVQRMVKGDPDDPLLRQVLPQFDELHQHPDFFLDPVGDHESVIGQGVLQKYHGRVLIMTTAACAIHCRYCFRRHFPYSEHSSRRSQWQQLLATISHDTSIQEVILSGGDPLSLDDPALDELITLINHLPQIKRIRIHSRYPIVLPERVDDQLTSWLKKSRCPIIIVVHSNHANEINDDVRLALTILQKSGARLFNQAVLLKGINDNSDTLADLSETLFDAGVTPYYLHMLDRVAGASHFEVEHQHALQIMKTLRQRLPGYLVPKLVREEAGLPYKQPVES